MKHPISRLIATWFCLLGVAAMAQPPSAPPPAGPAAPPARPVIVLVHGAAGGGWQFKPVAALLEAKGWTVYRPSLSGLGEHYHTATADIGLGTHIDDIVNLILFEELHDVTLLGHSYAGLVITGVANRIPERIHRLIYLDAFLPADGESLMTVRRPDAPDMTKNVKDGFLLFGRPARPDAPLPRQVPHPFKTFTDVIALKNPALAKIPVTFILTVAKGQRPEEDTFYYSYVRARDRGWPALIMEGDHYPMLRQPEALTGLILDAR